MATPVPGGPSTDRSDAPHTWGTQTLTLAKALNNGLRAAMEADPRVLIMGEDVGKLGGVFRVTDGLQKDFGEDRVIDTPLAESGIVGTAIGLALRGFRPVCEIQFDGFVFPATNQIVTQLAKMRYRSRGNVALPVTIRIPCGGGIGAVEHHSESPEILFAHTAGLRVVACADAADAFAMIQQSISCDDPVIFFEPKRRYWDKSDVDTADGLAQSFVDLAVRRLNNWRTLSRLARGLDNPIIAKDGISRMRSWRAPLAITLYLGLLGAFGYAVFTISVLGAQFSRPASARIFLPRPITSASLSCGWTMSKRTKPATTPSC